MPIVSGSVAWLKGWTGLKQWILKMHATLQTSLPWIPRLLFLDYWKKCISWPQTLKSRCMGSKHLGIYLGAYQCYFSWLLLCISLASLGWARRFIFGLHEIVSILFRVKMAYAICPFPRRRNKNSHGRTRNQNTSFRPGCFSDGFFVQAHKKLQFTPTQSASEGRVGEWLTVS